MRYVTPTTQVTYEDPRDWDEIWGQLDDSTRGVIDRVLVDSEPRDIYRTVTIHLRRDISPAQAIRAVCDISQHFEGISHIIDDPYTLIVGDDEAL